MLKKFAPYLIASSLVAVNLVGFADTADSNNSQMFIEVGPGLSQVQTDIAQTLGATTVSTTDSSSYWGWHAGMGGIYHYRALGFGGELRYNAYAPYTQSFTGTLGAETANITAQYQTSSLSMLSLAQYYFNPTFKITGIAGLAYVLQKLNFTVSDSGIPSSSFSLNNNHVAPVLGLGLGYDITTHIGVAADIDYIFGTKPQVSDTSDINYINNYNSDAPIASANLSLIYSF